MLNANKPKDIKLTYEDPIKIHPSTYIIGNSFLGAYSYVGQNCILGSSRVGRYCSIAPNVTISLGEHPINTLSTHPFFFGSKMGLNIPDNIGKERSSSVIKESTKIGNDVWIGAKEGLK